MYKLGGRRKLGKTASHRRAMIGNQLKSLLNESKVRTTTPKAKVLKANAESYLAKVSRMDKVSAERAISEYVTDLDIRKELVKYVSASPIVKIVRVGFRAGDNAELSRVTLDGYVPKKKSAKSRKSKREEKKIDENKEIEESSIESSSDKGSERAKNITKSLRDKVIGKERARTRSGL